MQQTLPVDASTALGTILILACVLPTTTLQVDAVKSCHEILRELENHLPADCSFRLLPNDPDFVVQLNGKHAAADDIKRVLRSIQLPWCKLPGLQENVHVALLLFSPYGYMHLRFARKLPGPVDRRLPISSILVAMLRLRGDKEFWQCLPYRRMLKRLVHLFSQGVDAGVASSLLEECPNPDIAAKYHPHNRASRLRGNKALEMGILGKFLVRGGGFVSSKTETHLGELGIMKNRTALAQRTSSEYVVRSLVKQADFVADLVKHQTCKTINVAVDAASVCHEQVLRDQSFCLLKF